MFRKIAAIGPLLLYCSVPAAQTVTLEFHNGRVSLSARDVPVRMILFEWGRLGETRVLNGDDVSVRPVTLTLVDVPEPQALAVVLRDAAGYVATHRDDQGDRLSAFDRILILATSDAPQAAGLTQPAVTRPPIEQVLLPLGLDIREQPPAREPEATR